MRLKKEDVWKITFKMRKDFYKWLVIPFGLCNALATFMRLMNDVLCPFINSFLIVYLDNVLIFNDTSQEHLTHVIQVVETLKKNPLIRNMKKC
jgi:hypothetical protein